MSLPLVKPAGGFDLDDIQAAYVAGVRDANAFFSRFRAAVPVDLVTKSADAYVKMVAVPLMPAKPTREARADGRQLLVCSACGKKFTQSGRGRPRIYCLDCRHAYGSSRPRRCASCDARFFPGENRRRRVCKECRSSFSATEIKRRIGIQQLRRREAGEAR